MNWCTSMRFSSLDFSILEKFHLAQKCFFFLTQMLNSISKKHFTVQRLDCTKTRHSYTMFYCTKRFQLKTLRMKDNNGGELIELIFTFKRS